MLTWDLSYLQKDHKLGKVSFVLLEAHLIPANVTEYCVPMGKPLTHHVPRHGVPFGVVPTAAEDV